VVFAFFVPVVGKKKNPLKKGGCCGGRPPGGGGGGGGMGFPTGLWGGFDPQSVFLKKILIKKNIKNQKAGGGGGSN